MARTEKSMLTALLDPSVEKLTDTERSAFTEMLQRVNSGWKNPLSERQMEWVESVYLRLELDADEPAENLYSRGQVPQDASAPKYAWETAPKHLKPPGRK